MAEKVVYKNYCIAQEQATFSGGTLRWYKDSQVGRVLSGTATSKSSAHGTTTATGILHSGTFSTTINASAIKFIYLKNTDTDGSDFLLLNIGGMGATIKLMPGESFASDIGETASDNTTIQITASGTPGYEYIKAL